MPFVRFSFWLRLLCCAVSVGNSVELTSRPPQSSATIDASSSEPQALHTAQQTAGRHRAARQLQPLATSPKAARQTSATAVLFSCTWLQHSFAVMCRCTQRRASMQQQRSQISSNIQISQQSTARPGCFPLCCLLWRCRRVSCCFPRSVTN